MENTQWLSDDTDTDTGSRTRYLKYILAHNCDPCPCLKHDASDEHQMRVRVTANADAELICQLGLQQTFARHVHCSYDCHRHMQELHDICSSFVLKRLV